MKNDIRHWIRLVEVWVANVNPNGDHPTDVHIDPSRGEIAKLLKAARGHVLRGNFGSHHLYVWEAYGFVHSYLPADILLSGDEALLQPWEQREEGGIIRAANIMIDQRGPYLPAQDQGVAPDNEDDPDADDETLSRLQRLREFCDQHPMMHRAFGSAVKISVRDDGLR